MKIKRTLLVAICTAYFFQAHSQAVSSDQKYLRHQQHRKFYFSADAGLYRSLGASNTVFKMGGLSSDFTLPALNGFSAGCSGAYFFTKNYGIGVKYNFYTAKYRSETTGEYVDIEDLYDFRVYEGIAISFKEQTHFFGPAVFAQWFLGGYRWSIASHAGVVYLYDKLSKIKRDCHYIADIDDIDDIAYFYDVRQQIFPQSYSYRGSDHTGSTIGFTLSAGIRYRIISAIGIGVYANGLFASLSQMKSTSHEYAAIDISRKINRVRFSAGLDFSF